MYVYVYVCIAHQVLQSPLVPHYPPTSLEPGNMGYGLGSQTLEFPVVCPQYTHQLGQSLQVHNGRTGLRVGGDDLEYPESAYLALDVVRLQQVDECVQPPVVPDS